MSAVEAYLAERTDAAVEVLKAFCRIPSVSTDPAYSDGIRAAAAFIAERLKAAGLPTVEILETDGHPSVFAESAPRPGLPTILVYGHYDVQPPDPLGKWQTPPFEPTIRDDRLFARGVSDDKGPLLIPVLVVEAFLRTEGRLPLNVKFLLEGEEETGSPNLEATIARHRERFACDLVVSADGAMWRPDLPSVLVAGRGLVALNATVTGAAKDLHSGRNGGSAPNPIQALAGLLAGMHGPDGRVAVAGFHDGSAPPDPAIIAAIEQAKLDAGAYYRAIGSAKPDPITDGRELLVRQWLEPTLEFNGISGGYEGAGRKTVIPSTASVKITCRIVAGQKPEAVVASVRRHLESRLPKGFSLAIEEFGAGSEAFSLPANFPALALTEEVLGELLGAKPLRVAMGATIPICGHFKKHLGAEVIFFSFSITDEDYHAPNEFFRLESFRTGLVAWTRLLARLPELFEGRARS